MNASNGQQTRTSALGNWPEHGSAGRLRVDPRQYIFSFPIRSLAEVPPRFRVPHDAAPLVGGVFLPQHTAGWPGRRKHPARILLLTASEVMAVAHACEPERAVRIPIHQIVSVESGRILLLGWLAVNWEGGRSEWPYNTCNRRAVDGFLTAFKNRWLPPQAISRTLDLEIYGEPPSLKFTYAQAEELVEDEIPLARFFQPAVCRLSGRWWPRRQTWSAGDLLLVTSRRLLWIEERYKGRYERYGTVHHWAALASLAGAVLTQEDRAVWMTIGFCSGEAWKIPLEGSLAPEAAKFAAAVRRIQNENARSST